MLKEAMPYYYIRDVRGRLWKEGREDPADNHHMSDSSALARWYVSCPISWYVSYTISGFKLNRKLKYNHKGKGMLLENPQIILPGNIWLHVFGNPVHGKFVRSNTWLERIICGSECEIDLRHLSSYFACPGWSLQRVSEFDFLVCRVLITMMNMGGTACILQYQNTTFKPSSSIETSIKKNVEQTFGKNAPVLNQPIAQLQIKLSLL